MPVRKKAPEDLTAKKALALEVIQRLKAEYPDAGCTLDYDHAWQLLVSVRLAAQCTDARVNIVVEDLFARYPSVAALAAAEPEDIEAIRIAAGCGVALLATAHAQSVAALRHRALYRALLDEHIFRRAVCITRSGGKRVYTVEDLT